MTQVDGVEAEMKKRDLREEEKENEEWATRHDTKLNYVVTIN